jgi:hypothetical protein
MNPATTSPVLQHGHPPTTHRDGRALGILLLVEALLALAPVLILGAAIGWPASLDRPAAEQLAAVAAAPAAVSLGYGLYLLYSLLIAPLMIGLAARLPGGLAHPLGASIAAFAVMSALARALGILRWLTVMPALAAEHAAADAAGRRAIEPLFDALTTYGGGIGEVLGVSLLMAFALGLLCAAALRGGLSGRAMPRPLAVLGLVVSALLAGLALPSLGIAVELPVALAVSGLSLWMLLLGLWMLRRTAE